jgi:GcrA cell cycle regulator
MTISVHSDAPERGEVPLRQRRPRAAATTEFGAALTTLGLPQNRVAKLFGVSCRHIRRWQHGNRTVPRAVRLVINLLVAGAISIDQVEAAADPVPAQTNGVKPALPARLRDEPEPKPPASLRVEPAPAPVPANPGPTTLAEKVFALAGCRWPLGNPKSPDFRFCARPIARGSYCNAHHVLAYAAQPLPKARPGF